MLPAMAEIGRRWEFNEMEVFQEHLATEAIQSFLAGLPLVMTGAVPKQGPNVLVSCVPGEEHALIPLALTAYLEFKGWSVRNLGRSLPSGQIVRAVTAFSPDVLFLTFTTISRLDEVLEVIEQCRVASARCRIILGGRGAVAAKAILENRGAQVANDFGEGFRLAAEGAKDA
jgi:methanogenic corrinoid protein MtbC1